MDKEKNRKQELNKLKKLLAGVEENKRKAAESLAQEVAYMKATLLELRGIIDADGLVCEGARGPTEHPAVKTYNTMIQRYATLSKQIFDLLPEGDKKDTTDELMDYVKGAKR